MKFKPSQEKTAWAIYAFLVVAAAIVFASVWNHLGGIFGWLGQVLGYVMPVIYGFVLAFLFSPILRFFDDRLLARLARGKMKTGLRRVLAILLTYLVVLIVLATVLLMVLPRILTSLQEIARQISGLVRTLPEQYAQASAWIASLEPDSTVSQVTRELLNQVSGALQSALASTGSVLGILASGLANGLAGMMSGVANWAVGVVVSIYILASRERLLAQGKKLLRALLPDKAYVETVDVARDTYRIFSSYLGGAVLDACCVGIVCFICMSLFGWPYAMLISVIIACTNVIPFFGPFIGAIPSLLILLAQNPWFALGFLVFIIVLQQIDGNIIAPRIVGSSIGLPPLLVVFGILFFGGLMGILGMFIGVPLFAVLYALLRRVVNLLLGRKNLPTALSAYASGMNQIPPK